MLIKNSITKGPLSFIFWCTNLFLAITILINNYSLFDDLQKNALTRELNAIKFSIFKSILIKFNAKFNSIIDRLKLAKINNPINLVNRYFQVLKGFFLI